MTVTTVFCFFSLTLLSRRRRNFKNDDGGDGNDDDDSDVASHTPWRSHGLLCLAPASRAAPYGASAIIGELRCLFGSASADQSRLAARSSPVLAFVSLLAVPYRAVSAMRCGMILRLRSHRTEVLSYALIIEQVFNN